MASPSSTKVMPLGTKAMKLWPAEPRKWIRMVSSGRPSAPVRRVTSLPSRVPTVRLTLRMGSSPRTSSPRSRAGWQSGIRMASSYSVSRPWFWATVQWVGVAGSTRRLVEDGREVHAPGLPVVEGAPHLQALAVPDHLVEAAEAEGRHQLAHLLGHEAHEVHGVLGVAR